MTLWQNRIAVATADKANADAGASSTQRALLDTPVVAVDTPVGDSRLLVPSAVDGTTQLNDLQALVATLQQQVLGYQQERQAAEEKYASVVAQLPTTPLAPVALAPSAPAPAMTEAEKQARLTHQADTKDPEDWVPGGAINVNY